MADGPRPSFDELAGHLSRIEQEQAAATPELAAKQALAEAHLQRQKQLAAELQQLRDDPVVKSFAAAQAAARDAQEKVDSLSKLSEASQTLSAQLAAKQADLVQKAAEAAGHEAAAKAQIASETKLQADAAAQKALKTAESSALAKQLDADRSAIVKARMAIQADQKAAERAAKALSNEVKGLQDKLSKVPPDLEQQLAQALQSLDQLQQQVAGIKDTNQQAALFAARQLAEQQEQQLASQVAAEVRKIQASLAKYSKQIKVNQPVVRCGGNSEQREKVAHGGECHSCQKSDHFLDRTPDARQLVAKLCQELANADPKDPSSVGLTPKGLQQLQQGTMIGVMIALDQDGNSHVLAAYSGALETDLRQGTWCSTAGGVPKVTDFNGQDSQYDRDNDEIDNKAGACAAQKLVNYAARYEQDAAKIRQANLAKVDQILLKDNPYQRPLLDAQDDIERAQNAERELAQGLARLDDPATLLEQAGSMLKEPGYANSDAGRVLQNVNAAENPVKALQDLQSTAEGKRIVDSVKANAEQGLRGKFAQSRPKNLDQAKELVAQNGKYLGRDGLKRLAAATSDSAKKNALEQACARIAAIDQLTPPTGAKGPLIPVGIAEMWFGAESTRSFPPKQPGQIYDSCETCKSTLGTALCGLDQQRQQLMQKLGKK